ncbi:MAG: spore germination protein, partial [Clostridia bacterium]
VTIIGGVIGIYGIMISSLIVLTYLASLSNYGTPYLAPFAPNIPTDKKDAIIKAPFFKGIKRPKSLNSKNYTRLDMDKPPKNKNNK